MMHRSTGDDYKGDASTNSNGDNGSRNGTGNEHDIMRTVKKKKQTTTNAPWVSPEPFHDGHEHEHKSDQPFHDAYLHDAYSSEEDGRNHHHRTDMHDDDRSHSEHDHSSMYGYTDPAFSPIRNGLHHRTTTARSQLDGLVYPGDEEDATPLRHHDPLMLHTAGSNSKHPSRFRHRYGNGSRRTSKRARLYAMIKTGFAIAICVYVGGLVRQSMSLSEESKSMDPSPSAESPFRQYASKQTEKQQKEAHSIQLNRSLSRKLVSRPSHHASMRSLSTELGWYSLSLPSTEDSIDQEGSESDDGDILGGAGDADDKPADVEKLCGYVAQNGSINHPESYPTRLALNSHSKVVITGIVSNPIGFSLAMTLATKCGVTQIMGVDQMFPNSVQHRLAMQERIQLLTTKIPKLAKPIILPYSGLDPSSKKTSSSQTSLEETGEWNFLADFQPTHVVHLAATDSPLQLRSDWANTNSPYVSETYHPQLFDIRNSAVSMEQLLAYITDLPKTMSSSSPASHASKNLPQLVYSSTTHRYTEMEHRHEDGHDHDDGMTCHIHANSKAFDEIMSSTYHQEVGLKSIGIRFPQHGIYGPWSSPASSLHREIEKAIDSTASVDSAEKHGYFQAGHMEDDGEIGLLHVNDAADAIIGAMQFQPDQAIAIDVSVKTAKHSNSVIKDAINRIANSVESEGAGRNMEAAAAAELKQLPAASSSSRPNQLDPLDGWSPKISVFHGLLKTVAWHLDRKSPFGGQRNADEQKERAIKTLDTRSGDALLARHNHPTCEPDDFMCHQSRDFLPCISECSNRDKCKPSIFDDQQELLWSLTEGCSIVLYTHSLGEDATTLPLKAEFMDEEAATSSKPLICNIAFAPRSSKLVQTVTDQVPHEQLVKFGVSRDGVSEVEDTAAFQNKKLDGLNGKILYRGWIMVWVEGAMEPLSITDKSLLKLSPGKLFHPDVKYGFFVEDNFSTSPRLDDVQFLIGEMKREAFPKRTVEKREELVNTETGEESIRKAKYRVPSEPRRRASILFAPLRHPETFVVDPTKKLSVHEASKFMRYEIDLDPNDKEPADIRRQREFYERIPSYMNSGALRSVNEPWYRYSMRHWVRTRWVVHDFRLEESRQLRCEWYQEHVQWGTDIDQLSFAHVMAKMELERRIAHEEPDDHVRTFIDEHPELRDLTDSYEWHSMQTENNRLYHEPMMWTSQLPEHIDKAAWERNHGRLEDLRQAKLPPKTTPLFVRIMSERMMALSRRAWTKLQKTKDKRKKNH